MADSASVAERACQLRGVLLGIARSSLGVAAQDAEDLVQETLLAAVKAQERYREEGTLLTWLCAIMRALHLNERRRRGRRPEQSLDADEALQRCLGTAATQETSVLAAHVGDLVAALPEDRRRLVLDVVFRQVPLQCVAEREGVPVGTVKSRTSRAADSIRRQLGETCIAA